MKTLLVAIVSAALGGLVGAAVVSQRGAERPATVADAPSTPAASQPAWRASNGVVLTADDIARIEARDRELEREAAELEYSLQVGLSKPRVKSGLVTSADPAGVAPKPER